MKPNRKGIIEEAVGALEDLLSFDIFDGEESETSDGIRKDRPGRGNTVSRADSEESRDDSDGTGDDVPVTKPVKRAVKYTKQSGPKGNTAKEDEAEENAED